MSSELPTLTIPACDAVVEVKAINGGHVSGPASLFLAPVQPDHQSLLGLAFSFFIENKAKGQRVLFDLGVSKDQRNYSPALKKGTEIFSFGAVNGKDVADTLRDGGIELESIDAVIWSHGHFDHIGDMTTLPTSVDLVFGKETIKGFFPLYPEDPNGVIHENDIKGRSVREINFEDSKLNIGGFRAHDYFGDGSFYLLDVPGHVPGHMAGLARVTRTTFILMGGDTCHHAGMLRPSAYIDRYFPCPGSLLSTNVSHDIFYASGENPNDRKTPLLHTDGPGYVDHETARASIKTVSDVFDSHPEVLVMLAHDNSILEENEFFPETLNDWKEKNWKKERLWNFLDKGNPAFRFL